MKKLPTDERDYEKEYGNTKADGGIPETTEEFEADIRDFLTGETLGENESFRDYNNRIEDALQQFDRKSIIRWLDRNQDMDEESTTEKNIDSTPNITINITTK